MRFCEFVNNWVTHSLSESNNIIENSTKAAVEKAETTTVTSGNQDSNKIYKEEPLGMDSLTIIWYLTTFIALLGFFIVMACTENSCARRQSAKPTENNLKPPSPCPSYKQFAPPSYDTVMKKYKNPRVFIVPVHENNNFFNQTTTSPTTTTTTTTTSPTSPSPTSPQREINSNLPKPNSIIVDVEKGEISVW